MTSITPSPALTLSEHTSIGDTISFLIANEVGSVIITAYDDPDRPVGIFTERDLLHWVLKFGQSNLSTTAIGNIMTKGLITVNTNEMDHADELMIQHHIRHIPVVYQDTDGKNRLAGMISMRDSFRNAVNDKIRERQKTTTAEHKPALSIFAKGGRNQSLQTSLLSNRAHLVFISDSASAQDVLEHAQKTKGLVFDIDGFNAAEWTTILKGILEKQNHPDLHIVLSPKNHDKITIETLKKMQTAGVLTVFLKPINLLQFYALIDSSLSSE
jgi:CBS domain-containing protein